MHIFTYLYLHVTFSVTLSLLLSNCAMSLYDRNNTFLSFRIRDANSHLVMLPAGFAVRSNYVLLKKCNMWQPLGPHAYKVLLQLSFWLLAFVQHVR